MNSTWPTAPSPGRAVWAVGTVSECCRRAQQAGLTWPLPDVDDGPLEARLFQRVNDVVGVPRPLPDWAWVHQELKRPGGTLPQPAHSAP